MIDGQRREEKNYYNIYKDKRQKCVTTHNAAIVLDVIQKLLQNIVVFIDFFLVFFMPFSYSGVY